MHSTCNINVLSSHIVRLSECLRTVPVSPAVQAAVFLCFRVLLLRLHSTSVTLNPSSKMLVRMSAVHITFLWPVIITEMVLVFSAMEHELAMGQPEFRSVKVQLKVLPNFIYTTNISHCTPPSHFHCAVSQEVKGRQMFIFESGP